MLTNKETIDFITKLKETVESAKTAKATDEGRLESLKASLPEGVSTIEDINAYIDKESKLKESALQKYEQEYSDLDKEVRGSNETTYRSI